MLGMNCGVSELVVFHPVDQIYNSISLWIITTAIDFNPYRYALFNVKQYALKVKQSLIDYSVTFHNSDPRYVHIINMTINDVDSVLNEIISSKIEASNLIDHIHKPRHHRDKRSLLPFGGLFNFLFGTADDEDVESMKQDIQRFYDNQVDQSNILNDIISITNMPRGLINENILKINQIISTISFLNETIDCILKQLKPLFTARRFLFLHTNL